MENYQVPVRSRVPVDEYLALAGAVSACAMAVLAILSLFEARFSMSVLHIWMQSAILMVCGLVCLQGETRLFYNYHEVVQENFGFALKPLGRGSVYVMAGLYCVGARVALVEELSAEDERASLSTIFGLVWYGCCMLMIIGGIASTWTYHSQRRMTLLSGGQQNSDIDAYYISS